MYKRVNELLGTEYKGDNEIPWSCLSFYFRNLSENFIEEFKNCINWEFVSSHQALSKSFMRKNKNYLNWKCISSHQILSWDFMMEFKDELDWDYISLCQPFIENLKFAKVKKFYLEKNNLYNLYQQTKERGWFIGYVNRDNWNRYSLSLTPNFTDYFLIEIGNINITQQFKARVWWKDLIMLDEVKNYEYIRLFKSIW